MGQLIALVFAFLFGPADAAPAAPNPAGCSSSRECMSCHDGTVAPNVAMVHPLCVRTDSRLGVDGLVQCKSCHAVDVEKLHWGCCTVTMSRSALCLECHRDKGRVVLAR